ncbi:MAG: hypothetical protein AAGI38_02785 [Bacteroidota bacterium]
MKHFFSLILFCLSTAFLQAQNPLITQYDLTDIVIDDPESMIFAEASNGEIWMRYLYFASGGRESDFLRFDGQAWQQVGQIPCTSCVRDMKASPTGKIWVGTTNGIYRWDDTTWTQVITDNALEIGFDRQGDLVFINPNGVFSYDGTTVTPGDQTSKPALINTVNQLVFDNTGQMWVLLPSSLFTYDLATGWTILNDNFNPLFIDVSSKNRMYVAGFGGKVNYYENGAYFSDVIPQQVFPVGLNFTAFGLDSRDVFWVGVQGRSPGVIRYDGTDSTLFSATSLIPNSILINAQFIASNDDVWVGSNFRQTVTRIKGGAITSVLQRQADFGFQVYQDQGEVVIRFDAKRSVETQIRLMDVSGRTVFQEVIYINSGLQTIAPDFGGLAKGVYSLVVTSRGDLIGREKVLLR